jgi:hypothetical protein
VDSQFVAFKTPIPVNKQPIWITIFLAALNVVGFAQIPEYVPSDGLVAWWGMDGNGEDSHTGTYNATNLTATPATDRFGNENWALMFSGSDEMRGPGGGDMDAGLGNAITFSCWLKASQFAQNQGTAVFRHSPPGVYYNWAFHLATIAEESNSNHPYFLAGQSLFENNGGNISGFALQLDEWHHVVLRVVDGLVDMHVDGIEVFSNQTNSSFETTSNAEFVFGSPSHSVNDYFIGLMDDVGVWNRGISDAEILALYQVQSPIMGCTDETACNYNSEATEDDGSCVVVNASNTVTACFGTAVSIDLGINTSVSDLEVTDNTPAQINLPIRIGNYSGEVAGFVLKSDLGPSSWSSIVHVTQSPMLTEVGKWWMPQLTELEDTCWISASNYAWNPMDKVQLIQFPVLDTLEVNSNYSVNGWDGLSGGLMVLAAQEQVIVNATLDMKGRGFRGFTHDSRVNSQDGVQGESWAGEGISSFDPNESGGGGGDGGPPGCQDGSGGGGGSSLSAGGIGLGDCGFPSNPGVPFASPTSTILLGSAGGEGGADEDGGRPGGGGNGGGAVLILCDNVQGAGLIDVGGNNGGSACQGCFGGSGSGMGGGGGGAGGSIVTPVTLEVTTNLLGGSGGPNAQCGGCTTRYGGAGSEGYVQNIDFSWTSQGLSIAWEDGQTGCIWQSSEFVANDTISYVILANDLEVCQGEIALVGISGCNDTSACNYSETDICNNACVYPLIDNDCNAGAVACSEGTVWDAESQTCVVANLPYLNEPGEIAELNPCYFDTNFSGLVDVTDLMNFLSVFGAACTYEE